MYPIIEEMKVKSNFKYLWMKYVEGANLNVHCARCLVGEYSAKILNSARIGTDIHLNEFISKYFYLCGVATPYVWKNNFHLAFKYEKGKVIEIERQGIYIKIIDAVEIPIVANNINHPKGNLLAYRTCRNWQFANMISEE